MSGPRNVQDDAENGVPPQGGEPSQTEEQRRTLRHKLRTVLENLNRDEEHLVQADPSTLLERLDEANDNFYQVQMPREGVIQSKTVAAFASLGKRKAQNLNTEFVKFNSVEFVEKVITQFGETVDGDRLLTLEGWNLLGEDVQSCFNRAAPLKCMLGTFDKGEVFTGKIPRARVQREKENIVDAEKTVLKEVKQGELSSLETTTKEVEERVLPKLQEIYESVGRKPICYFEFVTNPESYTQTVENIFHVSFLVKSGHAEVFLDDDRLPVIQPVLDVDEEAANDGPMHQMIQSLNYHDWQEIVRTFEIQEATLEPRS